MAGKRFVLVKTGSSTNSSDLFYTINPVFSGTYIDDRFLPVLWPTVRRKTIAITEATGGACYYFVSGFPATLLSVHQCIVESWAVTYAGITDNYGGSAQISIIPEADLPNFIVDFYAKFFPLEAIAYYDARGKT